MRLAHFLNKPEYFFRPTQLLRRLTYQPRDRAVVRLPNSLEIRLNTKEIIGRSLATQGVYDLIVSEAITRLLDPGELAVDVGANVGYMTAIMAGRVGPTGRVISYEPHPVIHQILAANVERWKAVAPITVIQRAVSERAGRMNLHIPEAFDGNCGVASLEDIGGDVQQVETQRLDDSFDSNSVIAFLKIDVEGHELAVLEGARGLLKSKRIRDIVFEDHSGYPSPVSNLLESHGYSVLRLSRSFSKPLLLNGADSSRPLPYLPLNYLATRDENRAARLFQDSGWKSLQGSAASVPATTAKNV
jgi:FkbM family methyltransferase